MPEISFQKAGVEDLEKFMEFERKVADVKVYSPILEEDEAVAELKDYEVYFILQDGKVVGSTSYQIRGAEEAYLSGLIIDPEFQGQGIARPAVEFVLDKLKETKNVWLWTHPANAKIIHLYSSYGFVPAVREYDHFGDGEPRIKMVLNK